MAAATYRINIGVPAHRGESRYEKKRLARRMKNNGGVTKATYPDNSAAKGMKIKSGVRTPPSWSLAPPMLSS
eukprot:16063255-Heterocapsa_arctica.AAC.1